MQGIFAVTLRCAGSDTLSMKHQDQRMLWNPAQKTKLVQPGDVQESTLTPGEGSTAAHHL